jgi:pilus assembly protein Flp/PilA
MTHRIWNELARFQLAREEGQTMAEYGLLIALIAIFVIGAVTLLGTMIGGAYTYLATHFYTTAPHRRRAVTALRARRRFTTAATATTAATCRTHRNPPTAPFAPSTHRRWRNTPFSPEGSRSRSR